MKNSKALREINNENDIKNVILSIYLWSNRMY